MPGNDIIAKEMVQIAVNIQCRGKYELNVVYTLYIFFKLLKYESKHSKIEK